MKTPLNTLQHKAKQCEHCRATERQPHPLFGFTVVLNKDYEVELCQKCLIEVEIRRSFSTSISKQKSTWIAVAAGRIRRITTGLRYFLFLALFFVSEVAVGQPGLPQTPTQAPIDGGLALLAAAGGAYAWKKLRSRNQK